MNRALNFPENRCSWTEYCAAQEKTTCHGLGLVLEASDEAWAIETACQECGYRHIVTGPLPPAGYFKFDVRFLRHTGASRHHEGISYPEDEETLPVLARSPDEAYKVAILLKTLDFQGQLISVFLNDAPFYSGGDGKLLS